ncbi:hypothetical protein BABINDRAFT_168699 [Babjeviella inositovora NRRL Y-12698]|uniref:Large ribosomal subunit protein bL21m n=1 Tax=Babjeviella inositovora NRRL Y-12698 TaxID=984486 RepID=A0A1E3QKB6_9ASCO|nr:uncharacterized protein BABINDRAFT_168699 [Babjeviella inositovora NRRL Y-12698]ODQ78125.1 hypothetical protein BABINDRAFT_168699 [Babjeviella inositovora NRRL Y-12698]
MMQRFASLRAPVSKLLTPRPAFASIPRLFSTSTISQQAAAEPEAKTVTDLTPLKLSPSASLYATIKVHGRQFLVTEGDIINLPYNVKEADIGDKLHLNDVVTIGNRDFTYHQSEGISQDLYKISCTVIEKTKKQLSKRIIKQKRTREYRRAFNKSPYTVVRVNELKLN